METEFIYYRHTTPIGVRIEEITGYEQLSGPNWVAFAKQVFSENSKDRYRVIDHYDSGAPFLDGESSRISVSHTGHMLVVASLPKTPEVDLSIFNPRTALGVDVESSSREQVLKVRDRYLSDEELAIVPADDITANIIAWTSKEALYKAALIQGIDFRSRIRIKSLPVLNSNHTAGAYVIDDDGNQIEFVLYSYESEGNIITLAISLKTATFKKRK